jgi:hypothetical protein
MIKIIAFAGRKQSGKTTSAEFVSNIFTSSMTKKVNIYNFADPLKNDICINILGLTRNQCYGTDEHKNELVDCYWDGKQLSAREVMQLVGTDIFRKLQTNVWASATLTKIQNDFNFYNIDLALIADCRFPNEVEAVKNAGGVVIKLNRNIYNSNHDSEIALDPENYPSSNFDLVIDNQNLNIGEQNSLIHSFLIDKGILSF